MDPFYLTLAVAAGIGFGLARRRSVARRQSKRRVVEQPNSHYTSTLVRDSETRHRWQNMPLDSMHEVNRVEVVRLLAKVEAAGVDALRANERSFLDYMAGLTA